MSMFDSKSFEERWNKRLRDIRLKVSAFERISPTQEKLLKLRFCDYYGFDDPNEINTPSTTDIPKISFIFDYSVSKRSLKRFDNILFELNKRGLTISHFKDVLHTDRPLESIVHEDFVNYVKYEVEESVFKIMNNEYVNRKIKFISTDLIEIIGAVTMIENAVGIISKYYEYDSDGNEICNLTYSIGDIVSLKNNRDSDYIVKNVYFDDELMFFVSKLISPIESEVILFDEEVLVKESEIISNRDFRIDQILK